jgi:hypothetical protein
MSGFRCFGVHDQFAWTICDQGVHSRGSVELGVSRLAWAGQVRDILRAAAVAVEAARKDRKAQLGPGLLADLRARYDDAVAWGYHDQPAPRVARKAATPGGDLARRLHDKAEQVWLFTREFQVPWTNNASEQALKGPKGHQAVSGYWHTTATLADYCRVRSYLVSARSLRQAVGILKTNPATSSVKREEGGSGRFKSPPIGAVLPRDLMHTYGKVAQCA